MIIRPRNPSARRPGQRAPARLRTPPATLSASVGGRPSRWGAPPTLATVPRTEQLTISGPAARTPTTRGGAGLQ